jgi:hypothetical protein
VIFALDLQSSWAQSGEEALRTKGTEHPLGVGLVQSSELTWFYLAAHLCTLAKSRMLLLAVMIQMSREVLDWYPGIREGILRVH